MKISELSKKEYDSLIETIAVAAHEVNRVYCKHYGDNSLLPWEDTPEGIKASARAGVIFYINNQCTPEEQHAEWVRFKKDHGYVYGPVKDDFKKTHPCLVPYSELPASQRAKDGLFQSSIKVMLAALEIEI